MWTKKDKNGLTHGRGYIYSLQYHLIWCTKYRKQILINHIADEVKTLLIELADEYRFKITEMEIMPDHIHLLLDCKPQFYIADMVKIIKGNTARKLFIKHPELKQELWGGHLWNPTYCVTTVSDRTNEIITEYIKTQKTK